MRRAEYPSLQVMVREFLAKSNKPVYRAGFAVAGPVIGGRMKTTNSPWLIEESSLAKFKEPRLNLKSLINHLEAMVRAVPILRPKNVITITAWRSGSQRSGRGNCNGYRIVRTLFDLGWITVGSAQLRGRSFRCSDRREAEPFT